MFVNQYYHMCKKYPLKFFINMFIHELDKREKDKAWQLYLVNYGRMDTNNFKQFEYKSLKSEKKKTTKNTTKRNEVKDEQILKKADSFINRLQKGR